MPPDILFDLDGTLIDSSPGILASFARVLAAHGLTPVVPLEPLLIGPPLAIKAPDGGVIVEGTFLNLIKGLQIARAEVHDIQPVTRRIDPADIGKKCQVGHGIEKSVDDPAEGITRI